MLKFNDFVLYELMFVEFVIDFDEVIDWFGYFVDFGVNCLEIMLVLNVVMMVDWGFLLIGYFGVDECFGK